MTKLSLCIPTYNRSEYLSALLDSILAQKDPDIEVVISDNASTDNTAEVVESYKAKFSSLVYVRQPENIGMDRNFLAIVENATGDYAWMIGDDDCLEPGAIASVKRALETWPDVAGLQVGVMNYDVDLKTVRGPRPMAPEGYIGGFEQALEATVLYLGYLSCNIVKRSLWNKVCQDYPIRDFFQYYVHVYIIAQMMKIAGNWGVIDVPCISYRSDNDRLFLNDGWQKRMRIDIVGYDRIISALPLSGACSRRIRSVLLRCTVLSWIKKSKKLGLYQGISGQYFRLLTKAFWRTNCYWFIALPVLLLPAPVLLRMYKLFGREFSDA